MTRDEMYMNTTDKPLPTTKTNTNSQNHMYMILNSDKVYPEMMHQPAGMT